LHSSVPAVTNARDDPISLHSRASSFSRDPPSSAAALGLLRKGRLPGAALAEAPPGGSSASSAAADPISTDVPESANSLDADDSPKARVPRTQSLSGASPISIMHPHAHSGGGAGGLLRNKPLCLACAVIVVLVWFTTLRGGGGGDGAHAFGGSDEVSGRSAVAGASTRQAITREVNAAIVDEVARLRIQLAGSGGAGAAGPWPPVASLSPQAKKRILVTGGAGFVGSNLVDKLMGAGHEVCVGAQGEEEAARAIAAYRHIRAHAPAALRFARARARHSEPHAGMARALHHERGRR
jgi:hypothetical protein